MANELGLRNVAFDVDDLQTAVDRLAEGGYGLVGDISQSTSGAWPTCEVRRGSSCPGGIWVSLLLFPLSADGPKSLRAG